jgi:hypothetical protein
LAGSGQDNAVTYQRTASPRSINPVFDSPVALASHAKRTVCTRGSRIVIATRRRFAGRRFRPARGRRPPRLIDVLPSFMAKNAPIQPDYGKQKGLTVLKTTRIRGGKSSGTTLRGCQSKESFRLL